jgi:tetratricopeptide (TPR) repeat protein
MPSLALLIPFLDYWRQLREGTRDNIIGGLVVAVVLGLLALFRKGLVTGFKGLLFKPSVQFPQLTTTKSETSLTTQLTIKDSSTRAAFVPPLMVDFVRRQASDGRDIVERIKQELKPTMHRLVVLWGAGGVGKTAIASEVARSLNETFNQRVAWVSADGREEFGLATLLDEVAEKLGRNDLRPFALQEKEDQVRDVVAVAPTLIVLDNFETIAPHEQVRCTEWLSQRAPCSTLITTRRKIEKAHNVPIEHMSSSEAHSLLQRLIALAHNIDAFVNLDRDLIIQTAEANPLILQWIVGQIDLAQAPQEVLEELSHGEGDAAQRVFDRSFNLPLLEKGGRALLLALSMFVPSATRPALAEVAGLGKDKDKKRFREGIKNLAALWLIQTTEGGQRLVVEGLTRELARARLSTDIRASTLRQRFITRFLRFAQSHSRISASDLNAVEIEKDNILSAVEVAFSNKDWTAVLQLIGAIQGREGGVLAIRGYWDDSIRCNKLALAAAEALKDDYSIAMYSGNLGGIFMQRGEFDEARRINQQALASFRALGSQNNIAKALGNLALAAHGEGDLIEARRCYEAAADLHKREGDEQGLADSLNGLASVVQARRDPEEARRLYNESLNIKKRLSDQSGIALTLRNLGTIAEEQGDLATARDLYDQSLGIERKLGDQIETAHSLERLGMLAKKEKHRAEAAQFLRESLSIFENLKSHKAEEVRRNLAAVENHSLWKWLH